MAKPVTEVELAGVRLQNPVMPASGTFGYGMEYKDLFDLNVLGAVVTKSVTEEARHGNALPRIAECTSGMLNSIGLQNPGVDCVVSEELPKLREVFAGPIIANVSGFGTEEFARVVRKVAQEPQVEILEVNISCPNVSEGGSAFGADPHMAERITAAVRVVTDKPIFMKLTPNVTDITEIAKACASAGADGISLINNFKAMRVDLNRRCTVTAMTYAGLSGPAIKPIALRMVNEVYHAVDLPIIGIGGLASADDVLEMIMAGATAVEMGTANLVDPWLMPRTIQELPERMEALGISDLREIRGVI